MMDSKQLQMLEAAMGLDRAGERVLALEAYRSYLDAYPGCAEGWSGYAGLLMVEGRLEEARKACAKALRLDRTCLTARINSALLLKRQGHLEAAKQRFRKIVACAPTRSDVRNALADCLFESHAYAEARVVLRETLRHEPDSIPAHSRLIQIYHRLGMWPEYREEIERRQRVESSCSLLDFERGYRNLLFGDLLAGWRGYEARWLVGKAIKEKREFQQPRWIGEPFEGKTLLLYHEQGFGDTLMFLRYAPMAKALGGRVLVEVQPALADLAATCQGIDAVIASGEPIPPFDLQLPMLSLPYVFQTSLDTIPAAIPYLDVPERVPRRDLIAKVMLATGRCTRIGLTWSGNPAYPNDVVRSIPIDALRPLAALDQAFFFGFHVEPMETPALPHFASMKACLSNFSDTAYAVSGMDLVITIDSAMAHLAGALGVPTLLLLPFSPDWRWMVGRDDSPWYPSMRLYRQTVPGDWEEVIQRVVADLTDPA